MSYKKLWFSLIAVIVISFGGLIYLGSEIYNVAPPIPERIVTEDGKVVFTGQDIKDGMNVWQSIGGQQLGTVWGHGSYVAPDWSADWLHREAVYILNSYSLQRFNKPYEKIPVEDQAMLKALLQENLRKNTYNSETGDLIISPIRVDAFNEISKHYAGLFTKDPKLNNLRESYAIPKDAIKDPARLKPLNSFFFWTSWAAVTNRPGKEITYTNNWPHEELVGNEPTSSLNLMDGI